MLTEREHSQGLERRRTPRYDIPQERVLLIRPVGSLAAETRCHVENVSRGGCRVGGLLPLRVGDTTMMELQFAERSIYVDARVERTGIAHDGKPRWTLLFVGDFQARCPVCHELFTTSFPPRPDERLVACNSCWAECPPTAEDQEFAWWWQEELGAGD